MDHRVEKVVSLIEADSSRKIRLDQLSRLVNLSSWRLCHLFKQETGVSVVHFVHTVRMTEAKNLLEATFLSIKEIRTRVGFPDESHFIRAFDKVYHISPSQYRIRYRQTPNQLGTPSADSPTAR